jgi:hypothetical protein
MPRSKEDPYASQLKQLVADVQSDSTRVPIEDLRPVLISPSIFELGRWVGPYHHFSALPVSLTWAFLRPKQTMLYLDHDAVTAFEAKAIDWRSKARGALAADFQRHPWTHEYRNDQSGIEAVAMLHEDGLGPSRLIMYSWLVKQFPQGFSFFVPERYCTFVIANDASSKIQQSVQAAVHGCFVAADVPMSESAYDHTLLKQALHDVQEDA